MPPAVQGHFPPIQLTSESAPTRVRDHTGARIVTTIATTLTPTTVTTVATHTRIQNAILPTLAGLPDILEQIAGFCGVLVREELRRTRELGPAIDAVDWAANDWR